jgi:hypothetical protein
VTNATAVLCAPAPQGGGFDPGKIAISEVAQPAGYTPSLCGRDPGHYHKAGDFPGRAASHESGAGPPGKHTPHAL